MAERSFLAVSVLLGVPVDAALDVLPEGAAVRARDIVEPLRDGRRTVRARALAFAAHEVAIAIREVTLS